MAVQGNAAEHGKVIVATVHQFVVAVAEISPVYGSTLMGFDDNCPCACADGSLHQFKIIVGPVTDVRIGVDVHVNNAF